MNQNNLEFEIVDETATRQRWVIKVWRTYSPIFATDKWDLLDCEEVSLDVVQASGGLYPLAWAVKALREEVLEIL